MTASTTIDHTAQPKDTSTPGTGRVRWQVPVFIAIAYAVAWLPALGRLDNPTAAMVLPIGPSVAALVVVGWVHRWAGLRALLRSTVDVRIGRWWWGAAIPVPVAAAVAVLTVLTGAVAPTGADIASALASFAVLPLTMIVAGPLGEELGWRGYLLPHLLRRHTPIVATLLLLPLWWGFHLPLMLTMPDRYGLWWILTLGGFAFTMTWLHLRSNGSVLLAIVFHAVANTATGAAIQLFAMPDRAGAARAAAILWLLVGGVITAVALRRRVSPTHNHV
jgi:membrane protease YdiL (CAAX protease family)